MNKQIKYMEVIVVIIDCNCKQILECSISFSKQPWTGNKCFIYYKNNIFIITNCYEFICFQTFLNS